MKAILLVKIDDSLIEGKEKFAVEGYLMQESDAPECYEAVGIINAPLSHPLKLVDNDFYIYDREYLFANLEREFELLKEVKEYESRMD